MSKFVTYANSSNLEPTTPELAVRSQFASFSNRDKLIRWINRIQEINILKLSERQLLARETAELFTTAKNAFDYAHKQPTGNKAPKLPGPEDVDSAGRTVLDFTSVLLNHYKKQITSIFYNNASGKQQPSSGVGGKESSSSKSVGDVLQVSDDAVKAFIEGVDGLIRAIINAPLQKEMDELYGWVAGSSTTKITPRNDNRISDARKWRSEPDSDDGDSDDVRSI